MPDEATPPAIFQETHQGNPRAETPERRAIPNIQRSEGRLYRLGGHAHDERR
jgi:hypothetical protein